MTPIQNKKALAQSTISAKADGNALFHPAMNGAAIHSEIISNIHFQKIASYFRQARCRISAIHKFGF